METRLEDNQHLVIFIQVISLVNKFKSLYRICERREFEDITILYSHNHYRLVINVICFIL